MFSTSKFLVNPPSTVVTDPYFNYTALLLNDTGTNGAQNNTFIDSSTNNFTITRNGNTTQGSFNPYKPTGYWGVYFDGSGYLVNSSSSSTLGMGTSDFTMEAWLYYRGNAGGYNFAPVFTLRTNTTGTLSSGDTDGLYFDSMAASVSIKISGTTTSIGSGTALSANTWTHLALTRQSGTVKLFVNGVQSGSSVSLSGNMLANYIQIGCDGFGSIKGLLVGYVSNLRFVKGTAVYTSNFTVPTTPLTAITNTSLLCLQDNRFKDNSSNNFTFSVTGTPKTTGFNPFAPTASYTTSAYGGSAYFDGNGDYLSIPSNTAFAMATGDFTMECWFYVAGNSPLNGSSQRQGQLFSNLSGTSTDGYELHLEGSSTTTGTGIGFFTRVSGVQYKISYTGTVNQNTWYHIAVVRSGTTTTIYLNGTSIVSGTLGNQNLYSVTPMWIGRQDIISPSYPGDFNGYISNLRFVKGTAVYTSNFTPPTAPVTAISGTSLLLNATNAGIYDATTLSDLETVGSAQVSTAQAKWGASSMSFNGTTDNLYIGKDTELDMGSGNFTIEWWMYPTTTTQKNNACIIASGNATWGTGAIVIDCGAVTSNKVRFVANPNGTAVIDPNPWTVNTWTYFAFVRNGNTLTLYRNGTSVASNGSFNTFVSTVNLNYNNATKIGGGSWDGANSYFTGYIEDLRITKGIARYTANFTPPTAAFPTR